MGFLVRLGYQAHIPEGIVLALVGEALLGPRQLHHVKEFPKAFPALGVGNVIPLVRPGKATTADAQVQAALADVVQGRDLLRHAHGMAERQHQHRRPYPNTGRFGGDSGGDDQGGRHDGRYGSPTFWGAK